MLAIAIFAIEHIEHRTPKVLRPLNPEHHLSPTLSPHSVAEREANPPVGVKNAGWSYWN